jgi:hypothetical protein
LTKRRLCCGSNQQPAQNQRQTCQITTSGAHESPSAWTQRLPGNGARISCFIRESKVVSIPFLAGLAHFAALPALGISARGARTLTNSRDNPAGAAREPAPAGQPLLAAGGAGFPARRRNGRLKSPPWRKRFKAWP